MWLNTFRHPRRIGTLALALAFLFAPILPAWASGPNPQDEDQGLSVPAQKKKGAGTESNNGSNLKLVDYPKLVIGPGDILDIEVYGENGSAGGGAGSTGNLSVNNQLPVQYQVDSDGVIVFPFLGRVKMTGLTPAEASEKIARLLSKPRKVTVLIQQSNTYWVSILGNVQKPGKYQILGKPTLLSALAEAGGPLPGTDMGGAILLHDNLKTKVDLNKYLSGEGPVNTDPYLYPGDTLMVQRSPWPDLGEIAIVASILASAAVVTVEISTLHH